MNYTHTHYTPYPELLQDEAAATVAMSEQLINAHMRGEQVDSDKLAMAQTIDALSQTVRALTVGLQMAVT